MEIIVSSELDSVCSAEPLAEPAELTGLLTGLTTKQTTIASSPTQIVDSSRTSEWVVSPMSTASKPMAAETTKSGLKPAILDVNDWQFIILTRRRISWKESCWE